MMYCSWREILERKGVPFNSLCPQCCAVVETMNQAIFGWEMVCMLWFQFPPGLWSENTNNQEPSLWFRKFIAKEPLEIVELMAVIAQEISITWNKSCFEGKNTKPSLVLSKVVSILHTFQRANATTRGVFSQPTRSCFENPRCITPSWRLLQAECWYCKGKGNELGWSRS